jgi:hypothetical protein
MSELWERLADKNESSRAFAAFCIYRDLPPKERSLAKIAQTHNKSIAVLASWSTKYEWVKRSQAYDDFNFKLKAIKDQEEAEKVLSNCKYTQMYQRVKALEGVADILLADIEAKNRLYLFGKLGETFNKDLIDQFRGTLEDIAKEVGGRVVRTENKNENNNTTITKGYVTVSPDMWDIIKGGEDDSNSTPK